MEYLRSKALQRLGLLRRIKCFLPRYSRKLFVTSNIIPLFDYADINLGDKSNATLMKKVQVLQMILLPKSYSICQNIHLLPRRSISLAGIS